MICNIAIPCLSQNKLRHYSLSWSFLLSLQTESIIKGLCFSILIYICLWWSTVRKIREGFCCSSRTFSIHLFFFHLCVYERVCGNCSSVLLPLIILFLLGGFTYSASSCVLAEAHLPLAAFLSLPVCCFLGFSILLSIFIQTFPHGQSNRSTCKA